MIDASVLAAMLGSFLSGLAIGLLLRGKPRVVLEVPRSGTVSFRAPGTNLSIERTPEVAP